MRDDVKKILIEDNILNDDGSINKEIDLIDKFASTLENQINKTATTSEALDKLKIVVDTTPCTISWVNQKLEYLGVNKTLSSIANVAALDFIGKKVGFNTSDKYFYNFTKNLFECDEETVFEELESHFGDEKKYFWVVGTKYQTGTEAVIIGIETTELKHMEERLRFSEKMSSLGEMAAGIAHEINNPLTFIQFKGKQLQKKSGDNKELMEMGQKIEKTVKRISKIIKGLKSFSRDSENDPYEDFDLNEIISESTEILIDKMKKTETDVTFTPIEGNTKVMCRESEISQVFVNLVSNGIDAIKDLDNKWINITGKVLENKVVIKVIDSGPGIPEDIQAKILQPFFTTKDVGKGTGLGLSISKGIIEKHNGKFFIDNNVENTCFTVELPYKQPTDS